MSEESSNIPEFQNSNIPVVSLISLGCAKNTVDSELILGRFVESGWMISEDPAQSDICLVNTCGFIEEAREEAASVLHELKADGGPKAVVALGCLVKRAADAPETDHFLAAADARASFADYSRLPEICLGLLGEKSEPMEPVGYTEFLTQPRLRTGSPHTAYLKISEGCSNPCTFCAIPRIRGKQISRPMDDIVGEARALIEAGAVEISLIAQDTTDYGHDLGLKDGLAALLEQLTDSVPDMDWIRVMYAYPGYVTDRLIEVMASRKQILPYLDIPLQHADPKTLYRMKRPSNIEWVHKTLDKMRGAFSDKPQRLAIRTTFIVGYPGETDEEYQALYDFVEQTRFDRVGTFKFSFEPGTTSEPLGDPVPAEVKEERWNRLMELQQGISLQINQEYVGKTLDVLVEGYNDGISVGRSYRDAPEIDGLVLVEGELPLGEIVPIRISGAMAYDLTGVPAGLKTLQL